MELPFIIIGLCLGMGVFATTAKSQTWRDLNSRFDSLFNAGKFADSRIAGEKALDAAISSLGGLDTNVADICHKLARNYFYAGRLDLVQEVIGRALSIRQSYFGPHSIEVARTKLTIGAMLNQLGKYEEARATNEESLRILEAVQGPNHIDVAKVLNNLGVNHLTMARYAEAQKVFERALQIYEEQEKRDHGLIGKAAANIGYVCFNLGRLEEAERFFRRAVIEKEMAFARDHDEVAQSLVPLGDILTQQEKYAEAESVLARSFSIRTAGDNLIAYAKLMMRVARLEVADSLYQVAVKHVIYVGGAGHPDIAAIDLSRASIASRRGQAALAESLFASALYLTEKTGGKFHPEVANCFEQYGTHRLHSGDADSATKLLHQALQVRVKNYGGMALGMSERDALVYSKKVVTTTEYLISAASSLHEHSGDSIIGINALHMKNLVTDGILKRATALTIQNDPKATSVFEELRAVRFKLAKLFTSPQINTKHYELELDSLSTLAQELETQLAQVSSAYRITQEEQDFRVDRIASVLPSNTTLVEFIRLNSLSSDFDKTVAKYLCIILSKNSRIQVIDLGAARVIDDKILQYRNSLRSIASSPLPPTNRDPKDYSIVNSQLYNLIWKPIAQYIQPGQTLFIAPDGGLNLISFAGLMDEKGKYLIEKHPIHYLSAGRDLLRISQDSTTSGAGLLAFGDPDYDATVAMRFTYAGAYNLHAGRQGRPPKHEEDIYAVRNVRSGCGTLSEMTVSPLPQTRSEVEAVAKSWKQQNKTEDSFAYLGANASEEEFKHTASGKKVVHLATHGYFLEGNCTAKSNSSDTFIGENPLLLSGLFLAGANLHGKDADSADAEDGILTALEVSGMDLRGTDLVVLSACETGLGRVEQGEGVYGLRRAFQMAGAKTVVSALWQVPDVETRKFMKTLYATMTNKRQTERSRSLNKKNVEHGSTSLTMTMYPELMQKVALQRIHELRLRGRPIHPFTWGAFVATGDWRIKP